jgi:hypothetical protein
LLLNMLLIEGPDFFSAAHFFKEFIKLIRKDK